MRNVGLVVLRGTVGGLVAGHGAQKLFGSFGGRGLEGTGGFLESLGLRPGKAWAAAVGGAECGGGVLTAFGFLSPLGPLGVGGAMAGAHLLAHRGKPIWATEGGGELPITNFAVAAALAMTGPGAISLDRAFGLRLPRWLSLVGLAAAVGGVGYAATKSLQHQEEEALQEEGRAPEEEWAHDDRLIADQYGAVSAPDAPAVDRRAVDAVPPDDVRATVEAPVGA